MQRGKLLSWPEPPLEWIGHKGGVNSISYSPNECYIATGSHDKTIRIWDAETGDAVGKPLEGHTGQVWSVAYSHNGQHIISGSYDETIRIWNAEIDLTVGKPLEEHTFPLASTAYSPGAQHIISRSSDMDIHLWDSFSPIPSRFTSYIETERPDQEGWVRDPDGGLLYWVPPDSLAGLHSPALLTIPLTSPVRSVSLHFDEFAFGKSWTQISNTVRP